MTTLTEVNHPGGFLISEAEGNRARDDVTIISGQNVNAGTVLGIITASGKYTQYDSNASDGSETAKAIAYNACDATGGDTVAAVIARDAEVNGDELLYSISSPAQDTAGAIVDLAAVGIIVR